MEKWNTLRLLGGIVNIAISAVGLARDASEVAGITERYWPLLTLLIGVVLVSWVVYDLNQKLITERPSISVAPSIEQGSQAVLYVKNEGITKADFSAKARIKAFTSPPHIKNTDSLFQLTWELSNEVNYPLKGGGDGAKLLIVDKTAVTSFSTGELGKIFDKLQKAGPKTKATSSYEGVLVLPFLMNQKKAGLHLYGWSKDEADDIPAYSCEIEVSIYADPALLKPFSRIYQLQLKGHGMYFTEKSIRNKKGSQS